MGAIAQNKAHSLRCFLSALAQEQHEAVWSPAADIYRSRDSWLIKLDLAGVRPEDVQISVEGDWLVIEGCRRDRVRKVDTEAQLYSMEISYRAFERRILIPGRINKSRIKTSWHHGMLLIRVFNRQRPRGSQ